MVAGTSERGNSSAAATEPVARSIAAVQQDRPVRTEEHERDIDELSVWQQPVDIGSEP
jgi:hypothetical protein